MDMKEEPTAGQRPLASGTSTRGIARSRRSIERSLPLLLAAVLALTLALSLVLTYATLTGNARADAEARLRTATRFVADLADSAVTGLRGRMLTLGNAEAIHRALAAVRADTLQRSEVTRSTVRAADAALQRLLSSTTDTGLSVELWTEQGRRIAFVGPDLRPELPTIGRSESDSAIDWHEGVEAGGPPDSVKVGKLYSVAGRAHFWVSVPVIADGHRVGQIMRQYRLTGSARTAQTIRVLSGGDVRGYYRNAQGDLWTSLNGVPVQPPSKREPHDSMMVGTRRGDTSLIAFERAIHGSPFLLVFERPVSSMLAPAYRTAMRIAFLSLLLVAFGTAASWAVSRRITRPLATVTGAAESIARGDYDARVPVQGADELARLATSFNRMADEVADSRRDLARQTMEAKAANRAKSDFLAVMSHELRTPLNAIAGYTELLQLELRGPLTEAQRRDLDRIRVSQQHLLGLISAVLDLTRIESGRVTYDLAAVAVDPLLAGVRGLVEPQANAKSLTLRYDGSPPDLAVHADREKLRQVLLNLLSNAIRFTPAGGTVTLAAAPRGSRIAITVSDTGPGIASDAYERIFEPFVQLDRSLSQPTEGIGLGLAISRDLARGMNGDLTVESQPGDGSVFTVTLARTEVPDDDVEPSISGEMNAAASRRT
jgi:signal transduction histidine kinase